jgi:hypothetical protein
LFGVSGCHYRDPYEAGYFTKQECLDTFASNKELFVKVANILLTNDDFYNSRQEGSNHADIMTPNSIITNQKKYFTSDEWNAILELFKTMPYNVARPYSDVFEVDYTNKDYAKKNEPDGYSFVYFKDEAAIKNNMIFYTQMYTVEKISEHWYFVM